MKNGQDRFGMPEENLIAAKRWMNKKRRNKYPFNIYVPTREEVATLSLEELRTILIGWMCHSPIEIVPSRTQIKEVRTALLNRGVPDQFNNLIEMCSNYVSYS